MFFTTCRNIQFNSFCPPHWGSGSTTWIQIRQLTISNKSTAKHGHAMCSKSKSQRQKYLFFRLWADTCLRVSQAGCSCERLLNSLCFRSHVLTAVILQRVSRNLWSPVLAQQDVDDFCMTLQCCMDQCTLAILISMSHLAQKGTQKGLTTAASVWRLSFAGLDQSCLCHCSP